MNEKKKILISPLDWGLGHTTRCIPIIKTLQEKGHTVSVACNTNQKILLKQELENVTYYHLDGYGIWYPNKGSMTISMIQQIPKILRSMRREYRWLNKFMIKYPHDIIISDNRFGFYATATKSIYITHQITIQGGKFLNPVLRRFHKAIIDRFNICWIPDTAKNELAGDLSKTSLPNYYFIGPLTRFTKKSKSESFSYEYLFIISGPEPQRSLFEKRVLALSQNNHTLKMAIIGGNPTKKESYQENGLTYYSHLATPKFYDLVNKSEKVIMRPGYSAIMDFCVLQKPVFFVPTPGQTEQEYLAKFFLSKHGVGWGNQHFFSLPRREEFGFLPTQFKNNTLHLPEIDSL